MLQLALTILATQGLVLLLMRPLITWYFKIDRMVEALESIDESLSYLPAVRQGRTANRQNPRRVA